MIDAKQIKRKILNDMRVELTEEFDRNFERKAFFTKKWKPRTYPATRGSLLIVTGKLRRSIRSQVQGDGVRFTSSVPYASIHNEGGEGTKSVKAHTRKSKKGKSYTVRAHSRRFTMPQRQFIGDGPETRKIIENIVKENVALIDKELVKHIKSNL